MAEYHITAQLQLKTGLHIGTGKGSEPTDAQVRRTRDGELLIPGRSLGGSLRTLATRLAPRLGLGTCLALKPAADPKETCTCTVCQLFGNVHPIERPSHIPEAEWTTATASRLWVYDATATARTHVRDGVGIDRQTGTAAENVKFDYEVVPAETVFALKLRFAYAHDDEALDTEMIEAMKLLLAATLSEWQAGRGQLGGNAARGLGHFALQQLECRETSLPTKAELINYLAADDWAQFGTLQKEWPSAWLAAIKPIARTENGRSQSVASTFLSVSFDLTFADLYLQNDPLVALLSGFDHAPLVEFVTNDGVGRPILSGSALRGVLRSHGEKIVRTLATNWAKTGDCFLQNCPACSVLVNPPKNKLEEVALASCSSRLLDEYPDHQEYGEESFCLSCRLFGNQERGSRLWVRDGKWEPAATAWLAQDFLAIDRFTGGGLNGAKFDAAPLLNGRFRSNITLHDPLAWELGWLSLLLRDLAEGYITLGFGAAKGYGRVKATQFNWELGYIQEDDLKGNIPIFSQAATATAKSGIYHLHQAQPDNDAWLPAAWQTDANAWVTAFNDQVRDFKRDKATVAELRTDTYFGNGAMEKLYGRSRAEVSSHE